MYLSTTLRVSGTDQHGAVRQSAAVKPASGSYANISFVGFGQNSDPDYTGGVVDNFRLVIHTPSRATAILLRQ